jgi:hypothetical protein
MAVAVSYAPGDAAKISDGVTVESPTGTEAKVWGTTNMTMEDMFRGTNDREVHIQTEQGGNITLASSNSVHGEVFTTNMTGTWTNVTRISAGGNWLEIYPEDKGRIDVRGDTSGISIYETRQLDDGQTDFRINGTNGGTGTVKVYNVPAGTTIAAIDAQSGAVLDSNTSTSNGVLWLDIGLSSHNVQLQSGDGLPQLSNPQPEGTQSTAPGQLSIDVNDTDFPNDDITVTFYLDGSQVGTDTLTSNSTASVSVSPSPGQHTVRVNATDSYGQYAVEEYTFGVPNTLYLRNETRPSQKISTPTNVSFYERDGDFIFSRNTSDGTIDLSGLNVTEFIVTARPQSDYTNRTVYIPDIADVQTIYLLNQTVYPTVENRFVLNDPTAQYGSESLLIISRGINNTYTRIVADEFGAEGVTATLQQDVRYRLRVRNNDGDTQSIGPYRADVSETVEVVPGEPTIPLEGSGDGWSSNAELQNRTLEYRYADDENETGKVTVWIHEKNNKSNTLVANTTYFNLGEFSAQTTLDTNESKQTWVVKFIIDRNNEEFTKRHEVSNRPDILPKIADEWLWIPGVLALFLTAGMFSVLNVGVGAVTTSVVGGILWWVGILTGPASAASVALAIFLSVVYNIYRTSGP